MNGINEKRWQATPCSKCGKAGRQLGSLLCAGCYAQAAAKIKIGPKAVRR